MAVTDTRPVRTCVGCRTRRPSAELVRLTWRAVGSVGADGAGDGATSECETSVVVADGPSDGRGAWLCRTRLDQCLDAAIRQGRFARAWRRPLSAHDHDTIRRALDPLTDNTAATGAADEGADGHGADAVGTTTGKG